MKNLLSKTLLCGVVATSFIIINCQKAPNRAVKAQANPNAKPAALKMGACTAPALAAITERTAVRDNVQKLIQENSKNPLDAAQKEALHNSVVDLAAKTKTVVEQIQAIKVSGAPADGCVQTDEKDAKKKTEHKLAEITAEDRKLAEIAKSITGKSNPIIDAADTSIKQGTSLKLGAELAKMMSNKGNLKGGAVISGGKILAGSENSKLLANKAASSCVVSEADGEEVAADSLAEVLDISAPKKNDANGRMMVDISLAIRSSAEESGRMASMSCAIADGASADKEIVKSLGGLVTKVRAAAPVGPAPAPAASGDPSKAAPAPAASGDATKAAAAGRALDILRAGQ